MLKVDIIRNEWTPLFAHYQKRWESLEPPFREVSEVVRRSIQEAYRTEGASTGMPWKKRTRHYPWPPLRKTGRMYATQIAAAAGRFTHSGGVHIADFSEVVNVSRVPKYHHTGTRFMPARQSLHLTEAEREKIVQIIGHYTLVLD